MTIKKPDPAPNPYVASSATTATDSSTLVTASAGGTSVYANGAEAITKLATTGKSGVFQGANVYLEVTEQNYITQNKTFTGDGTVGGANGQIQYNDNGSFGGSANLRFDGSNVIVEGIKTDNYYYANGTPFSGGGSNYGNANVVANLAALGSNPVSTTGNITGGNLRTSGQASATGNVTGGNLVTAGLVSATGNVTGGNLRTAGLVSATGNIAGNYFIGNGSQLTGIAASTGNIRFTGDAIYDLNGIILENADLTHGATAAVVLPANGNTDPIQVNNTYGNILLQTGVASSVVGQWTFDNVGNLTFPDNSGSGWPINKQRFGMGNIGAWLDGQWTIGEFSGGGVSGTVGIRIDPAIEGNTGMTFPSSADSVTQPVSIYSTGGSGIQLYTGSNNWSFTTAGQTVTPVLTVTRGDTQNNTIQGFTLNIGDGSQEAIITTPDGSESLGQNAQRLVINPGKGQDGTGGEGGDIYLWAGRGGNIDGNGGDVKIRGGYGPGNGQGGYIRIEAGDVQTGGTPGYSLVRGGDNGGGTGGYVQLQGGSGGDGNGGYINIEGGYGVGEGGNVTITGGSSGQGLAHYGNVLVNAGASQWKFDNTGNLSTPGSIITSGSGGNLTMTGGNLIGANVVNATTFRSGDILTNASGMFGAPGSNAHITLHPDGDGQLYIQGALPELVTIQGDAANLPMLLVVKTFGNVGAYGGGSFIGSFLRTDGPVTAGDRLVALGGRGSDDGVNYGTTPNGRIQIMAGDTWTSSSHPTYISFLNTPSGDLNQIENMRINPNGNVEIFNGNVISQGAYINGYDGLGTDAIYGGLPTFTPLGSNVVAQFTANVNSYAQINFQNISNGNTASTDFIATADNGNDSSYYLDLGINSSTFDDPVNYPGFGPNDSYVHNHGGNLILNPETAGKAINMMVGGTAAANIVAVVSASGVAVNGVVKTGVYTTGTIPSASTSGAGARAFVTDADIATWGNLYVGGAGNAMPVWSNGTNWYIG